ncbi:protein C19orf12 homolog isoform X2 [Nerophis ophidion]|uniref:protein C19orf12 homolog isoform X2 n=1 Tax=Nerophis ophidion TaxID=159077 RepID=UPI002AE09924|nr:protein C19orf12 homolog isoform X2 [Nerophis ophidion]XP_061749515.1 protein C19orf12 homolog isoform X2 [Nerophis ophidion]XP_061749516.1 protein C19orf12 homolog isoform X2 [Nerophis ophidion]XP_061749517.1 protein C19orf12 homolog isoform X2 [Nerophis ophidion]XP_061749518.1 protein C19orf12 homolog isoform X2 [Nerophis ophidion]XP_061749519.1 protein C19orf12 homolog isoform X2 [Nerophis ophidion]
MGTRVDDIMRLCCEISAHYEITDVVKNSAKGALVAGGSVFVGGLLGGPLGIFVGGVIGGLLGSWLTRGQFRPLPQILRELSPAQRQKLSEDIMAILGNVKWKDAAKLVAMVMSSHVLRKKVKAALLNYVNNKL